MKIDIQLLERIIRNLPNYIFVKDINSTYTLCNDGFSSVVGVNPIGKNDYELPWTKESVEIYQAEDNYIINTGESILEKEVPMTILDNQKILSVSKVPLYDEAHRIIGILGIYIDITEKKITEKTMILAKQKAEAANQAKTEFLENMRHDIRTPLTGIVGCAHLMKSEVSPAKRLDYIEDLVQSSDALLAFMNKILESITIVNGETPFLKKKFSLYHVLEQVIQLNRAQATAKKLLLNLNYDKKIPTYLISDPVRIQRVILELLTNALKYTNKGSVKISARLIKNIVRDVIIELRVSDTGMGIPKGKHNEIYTRFTRLTPSYQSNYPGTGLGLSLVKKFIEDLGGEIYIESELQQGTTFICLIPLQKPLLDESDKKKSKESNISSNKKVINKPFASQVAYNSHVLVVEDNAIALRVAQCILSGLGCQIDTASNGKTALEKIEKNHYDLILMDIGLPDSNGCEVTRLIRLKQRQQNSLIPIIGLTAHVEAEKKQHCLNNGMNAIYTKPLSLEKVAEILSSFIPNQSQPESAIHNEHADDFIPSTSLLSNPPILDIEKAVKLLGKKEIIKECLDLLVSGLSKDLEVIKKNYQNNDWSAIEAIVHKWRGGAGYCGAIRLEQACHQLGTALRKKSYKEAEVIYQEFIQVAEVTKEAARKVIDSK